MKFLETTVKRYALLIPLAVYAVIMLFHFHLPGISIDGQVYLQIARNIHYGIGLGWQALWVSPLHSILIALVAYLPGAHDLQVAAGVVSLLMGIALTVSLYFLAATVFNRKVGIMATIVVISFPHIISLHLSTEPEITYTAFLVASLALLLAAARNDSIPLAVLTGISFALAYLSRSEGFLIMAIALSALSVTRGFRCYKTYLAKICLPVVLAFFVTSSPYLYFLHKHYGALVISPKATYVMIWMKSRVYHDNDNGEQTNEDLWGLTPEGRLKWQQPSGISDLANYLLSHPAKSLSVYLRNLSTELPGRIANNSGNEHFPQVFPVYVVLLAIVAALVKWGEHSRIKKTIIFSPLLILLILPIFTGGWWKYLLPYVPLLFIAACGGLFLFVEKLMGNQDELRMRTIASLLPVVILVILTACYLAISMKKPDIPVNDDIAGRRKITEYSRNAGSAARQRFGPGLNYMVPWSHIINNLDGLWTPLPVTTNSRLVEFARENKVDYLIMEFNAQEVTKDELYRTVLPGLKIAGTYISEDNEYGAAFYELVDNTAK